ncbi:MAG: hypothetical protein LBQ14_09335, partial [Treponema sp.]|nr:hypothetical protein [Treponema sp.]
RFLDIGLHLTTKSCKYNPFSPRNDIFSAENRPFSSENKSFSQENKPFSPALNLSVMARGLFAVTGKTEEERV